MLAVFEERGKPEYPEKNLSEQGREPTTNSTHIWRRVRESNPGHIGGRRTLSPLRYSCSHNPICYMKLLGVFILLLPPGCVACYGEPYLCPLQVWLSIILSSCHNQLPVESEVSCPRTQYSIPTRTRTTIAWCRVQPGKHQITAPPLPHFIFS